jgi:hypothetical protein
MLISLTTSVEKHFIFAWLACQEYKTSQYGMNNGIIK